MKAKTMIVLAALATVPFIMVLGNSMLIPVLPTMKARLGLTQFQTGLMITAFSVPAAIVIAVAGLISDRIGRKKVIAPSLIIYGIGGLAAGLAAVALSKPYPYILGARIFQGIGAAGTAPVAMALVGDIFKSKERSKALGLLEASNGFGKVASPIAGSALALIAWTVPFFVYGLLAVPAALAVWFVVKETETERQAKPIGQSFADAWKACETKLATLLAAFLAGTVVLFTLFGILFYLSDFLEKAYGMNGIRKGLVLAGPVLAMSVTSYSIGVFLQNHRKLLKIFVASGMFVITGALTASSFIDGFTFFYISVIAVGIGNGFVLPGLNLLVTSSVKKNVRGLVTSMYGAVRFLGVAAGPPAFGYAMGFGRGPMLLSAAVIAGISAVLAAVLVNPRKIIADDRQSAQSGAEKDNAEEGEGESEVGDESERVALYFGGGDIF